MESVFESFRKDWHKLEMQVPYRSAASGEVLIAYRDCLEALRTGRKTLCVAQAEVSLDLLIPDVMLAHVTKIPVRLYFSHQDSELTDAEPLGRGAFGIVRRAVWRGKDVAVKLVTLEGNAISMLAREFSREVDMMSRIQHDSLVALYGVTEPFMGIVMEFVPTGDLQHNFHYPDALLDAERRNLNRIEQKIKTLQDLLETDSPDLASLRTDSLQIFAEVPEAEWSEELSEQTHSLLLRELLAARQLADSITPEFHGRLLVSDARLSLDLRLRVAHDVCAGLAYLHSCSPMICHNDLRSPNVFLLQIADPTRPVAKLADYGLCRWYSGPLKMGLEAWKWLAPEVLDHRNASSFTEKADIFSFGIVLWEVLSGAGINLPYAEYQQRFPRHADLISAIRQGFVQLSQSTARNSFGPIRAFLLWGL